jgi:hypothetical protein
LQDLVEAELLDGVMAQQSLQLMVQEMEVQTPVAVVAPDIQLMEYWELAVLEVRE